MAHRKVQKDIFVYVLKWAIGFSVVLGGFSFWLFLQQPIWTLLLLIVSNLLVVLTSLQCLRNIKDEVPLNQARIFLGSAVTLASAIMIAGPQTAYWTGILGFPIILLLVAFLETTRKVYIWGGICILAALLCIILHTTLEFPKAEFGVLDTLVLFGIPTIVLIILTVLSRITYGHLQKALSDSENHARHLVKANADLKRSNQDLEQFAHVASHDLRAPLRITNTYIQFLQEEYSEALDAEGQSLIENIVENVHDMDALIVALLEYAKLSRNEGKPEPVDTQALLEKLVIALQEETEGEFHLPQNAPTIIAKRVYLEQVFSNLLSNAVKFHRQDAVPEIHITWNEDHATWTFSVRDNGIGIAEKHFERIFGVFERLHTQDEYEGTGIGMAIVKRALELQGGSVWVESKEGEGSTFTFTIPKPHPPGGL